MRLYIGSGVALRTSATRSGWHTDIMHASFTYVADSQEFAETWALGQLQALHPVDDGFHNHRVGMHLISEADVEMVLRGLGRLPVQAGG